MNFETEVNRKATRIILIVILLFAVCVCLVVKSEATTHSSRKAVKTTLTISHEQSKQ